MLFRMMKHEWMQLAAGKSLWALGILICILAGYAAFNGTEQVEKQVTLHQQMLDKEASDMQHKLDEVVAYEKAVSTDPAAKVPEGAKPNSRQRIFRYALLPPGPLATLSVGQSDLYPNSYKVDSNSSYRFLTRSEMKNPLMLMTGTFDMTFFVIFLLPLFVLALTFDLLSREREDGTLALVLAQPVRLHTLIAAKAVVRLLSVCGAVVIIILLSTLVSGYPPSTLEDWLRLALFCMTVFVYGAFWCLVAVVVNSFGRSSASNALTLAGIWLALTIIVPALSTIAITTAYPPPSRVELVTALNDAKNEAHLKGAGLIDDYYQHHPELLTVGVPGNSADTMVRSIVVYEAAERATKPVLDKHDEQLAKQRELAGRVAYLSPATIVQSALNTISGSSFSRFQNFVDQTLNFHGEWKKIIYHKLLTNTLLTSADYEVLPEFLYQPEPAQPAYRKTLITIAFLGALILILLSFGAVKINRWENAS